VVEKIPHRSPDGEKFIDRAAECRLTNQLVLGPIRSHHAPCFPTFVRRLQLPQSLRLVDRNARRHVLLPVQRILQLIVRRQKGDLNVSLILLALKTIKLF